MNHLKHWSRTLALVSVQGLALLPAALTTLAPATALAQGARAASPMPRISAFDVDAIDRIEPGADLSFTLWGTPGAQASLQIAGAARPLVLSEVSPGVYQGSYTVSRRDRIAPESEVVGNLRVGNRVGTSVLDEPLQRNANRSQPAPAPDAPQIGRFSVTEGGNSRSGVVLYLQAEGTADAKVTARLPGAQAIRVVLHEDRPGVYRGEYRVQAADRLDVQAPIELRLRKGERTVQTSLERWHTGTTPLASVQPAPCGDCATVVSINRVEVDGDGSVVGTVAGGLLGGLVGSQFGGGNGRTAAGVAGAVGGALLGREVEKNARKREQFEVVVRLRNGQQQQFTQSQAPTVRVGEQVRIVDGGLQPAGG